MTSQKVDEVAYLGYASVYKDFQGTADFGGTNKQIAIGDPLPDDLADVLARIRRDQRP